MHTRRGKETCEALRNHKTTQGVGRACVRACVAEPSRVRAAARRAVGLEAGERQPELHVLRAALDRSREQVARLVFVREVHEGLQEQELGSKRATGRGRWAFGREALKERGRAVKESLERRAFQRRTEVGIVSSALRSTRFLRTSS